MILRFGFFGMLILSAGAALAHHSAPVFYKVEERITVSGTVTEFRFNNPHAILKFDVVAANGEKQQWTAETTVKLEGMPSQAGSYLMRITRAFREDGTEIGIPAGTNN